MYYFLSLDSPLPRTFKELLTRPGLMVKDYIKGKRKTYYSPVKYFILALAVYLIVTALLHFDPVQVEFLARGQKPPQNMPENFRLTSEFVTKNVNKLLFIFLLVLTLFTKAIYRKTGYSFTEFLAFSFFAVAQYILINSVVVALTLVSPKFTFLKYILLLYVTWALMQFTGRKGFWNYLGGFLIVVISFAVYVVLVWFTVMAVIQ